MKQLFFFDTSKFQKKHNKKTNKNLKKQTERNKKKKNWNENEFNIK